MKADTNMWTTSIPTNPSQLRRLALLHMTVVKNAKFTAEESRFVDQKVKQTNKFETKTAQNSLCPEGSSDPYPNQPIRHTKKAQYCLCSEHLCLTSFNKCITHPSKVRGLAVSHPAIVKNTISTVEESRSVEQKVKFVFPK